MAHAVAEKNEKMLEEHRKMMEAHRKMGTPGEMHEYFKNFVGNWKVNSQAWWDSTQEPMMSDATSTAQLLYGGRYLELSYRGQMMGQPFEGKHIVGYDNQMEKYRALWIDNTSTTFYITEGTLDKAGATLTYYGEWADPTGKKMKVRDVLHMISPTEFTYEMYVTKKGQKEFKTLENHYYKA